MLKYKFFIDTGGTFTDCIGIDSDGNTIYQKVLSSGTLRASIIEWLKPDLLKINHSWKLSKNIFSGYRIEFQENSAFSTLIADFSPEKNTIRLQDPAPETIFGKIMSIEINANEEAPVLGIRLITETSLGEAFPAMEIRLGSTKGTNALLENKGAKTALFITKGFKDLLFIGNQSRPDIFAKKILKRIPLAEKIIEVDERISSTGLVIKEPDKVLLEKQILDLKKSGYSSLAVALLNSVLNPVHEKLIKKICTKKGIKYISVSSELSPLIKLLERTETSVVNAYLSPVIDNYLSSIKKTLGQVDLKVMTSAGGLIDSESFFPKDSLVSGPAGGVVGASIKGKSLGIEKLISFDMGGTSTDASRFNRGFDYVFELNVGSARIMSPSLAIETVAAGGGSVCGYDGFKFFVGPESAGASPGPACYGAGGPLTITDINLLAGRLLPDNFSIPLYPEKSKEKLLELMSLMEQKSSIVPSEREIIYGFLSIANEIMARAIKKISLSKGYNPKEYCLVSFGGAGGLHCCDIASQLGINKIIIPKEAGLLSAWGIGSALIERMATQQILQNLNDIIHSIPDIVYDLSEQAKRKLVGDGISPEKSEIRKILLFLRFIGQDSSIEIEWNQNTDIIAAFRKKYTDLYGHWTEREIELEAIRVIVSEKLSPIKKMEENALTYTPEYEFKENNTEVYNIQKLSPGAGIAGPAIILDDYSTIYIPENWDFQMDIFRNGLLSNKGSLLRPETDVREAELELFTNRFMSVAENMGAILQRTALSVNIKERLDYSCALLDAKGYLVANAPHIPVHLGGLGVCVRTILETTKFRAGDTIITNHPGYGGSHLPDITTISPVFIKNELIAFVVNRAHHSELGGISPGSMPPGARNLAEEGVVIKPFFLVRDGVVAWEEIREIFKNAPYPSRSIEENMADLNASIAANNKGKEAVLELIDSYGKNKVFHYFSALRNYASSRIRSTLKKIPQGKYTAIEKLDDGSILTVTASIKKDTCVFDFTGSSAVHPGNMNATVAIVNSVVIYVLRLLLDEDIPLNDGLLEPVEMIIPSGMLNPIFSENPFECPAVVGGNVEISQRLTDTLLKAFGTMGASQGTMNNVLFGNENFGYYETLAGGTGAGPGFHGADATHHHMTNTRITDPEVIENRFPIRLRRFEVRMNSQGKGKWNGGNGLIREYEFLQNANLSLLSQRRESGPFGMNGGKPAKPGTQYIIKKTGEKIAFEGTDNANMEAGDRFIIETPGGGGYG